MRWSYYLLIQLELFPTQGLKRRTSKQNLTSTGLGYRRWQAPNQVALFCIRAECHDWKLNNLETGLRAAETFRITKKEWKRKEKGPWAKTFCPTKKEYERTKKPDRLKSVSSHWKGVRPNEKKPVRLKNDSCHRKGVTMNLKGLKAIKGFPQPKRTKK
jgi:hypothetical protein